MPPRFAYWTILAGGLPTSFRAAEKDELMPTFRRLKEKHPDAEMKYFARGKLWESAEEARRALVRSNQAARPSGEARPGGERERRGRDWRPGGEHRDPRQRFKDAKKARNQDRRDQRWRRKNDDRPSAPRAAPQTRPHGDPLAPRTDRRPAVSGSRHGRPKPQGRPFQDTGTRPPGYKPHGNAPRGEVPRRRFQPSTDRRFERNEESPPGPPRPDREPPPKPEPKPGPPPRPSEPEIKPPGPPERGRRSNAPVRRKRRREE
jgi:hypothetical protein